MITILGFGARLTSTGAYATYIELGLPTGETRKVDAPEEFIASVTEVLRAPVSKQKVASIQAVSRQKREPEPYVLEPEFEPPFPAVSQAPGRVSKVAEAQEGFSAKVLLSSLIKGVGREPEPEPKSAPTRQRMAPYVPIGEFLHFQED